ncbi:PREDICTED: metabotropic glutamate receptor 2-like [Dinoponera quadriceps]|uniref:Metabotropic glutamate receptor 2-like n=1 Tax=Dinoponera quadriceps TaxID=609295 RepID=A0A6P3X7A9_DINQU|nr:PREDICTED: metabotropic glutamate receptor 2-like [Dinoponera quadriceps]
MASDSLEIPFIAAARTPDVSALETPALLIKTADRSAAVTEIEKSGKEAAVVSAAEVTVRAEAGGGSVSSDAPSIGPISPAEGRAGSAVPIIDPLPQRSSEPARDVLENTTAENVDDSSAGTALPSWPVKHSAVVEGDLVLGGLMMVHEREDTITCGPVMPQGGVQALEAMLYTLDTLNEQEIVPGVKIGAHILDDCDKDTYGLEMAVDFIKGSISNIDGAEYHCNKTAVRKIISGVVGAASSVTSIQVANLLRLFRIPQVSFFSTSPELSNKQRFEYFTRTIPSDHYQVKAMVDIVLKMGWSYVSIIYEESNYGIKAFEELEELLGKNNICIAVKEKLVKDSGVAEETAYDNIVLKLLTKPRARGCIIFGSDQEVAGVMRAVSRRNATGAFSWIGSDGWSARGLVSNGNEPEVEGTLSVQPQANRVKGFEEYFLNLTVENNRRNPWFVEFWEDHFKCRYPNSSRTPYNKKYTKTCTTKERLTKQDTAFEDQLQFVSDAVMAFAYAFRDMHHDLCQGRAGLCDAMKPTNGTKLLQYLRKVDFKGLSGDEFRFDKDGDGPARYNIIHFKQTERGKYKWVRVGKYLEGELRLNMSEIQFKLGHPQPPESVCSLPCEVGQAKKYVEGEGCCWHCFNCTQYQIRDPKDETQCSQCRQGTVPDETHSTCREIPEEFLRPESGWAIGAMFFSAVGILVTLFVCGVFLRHNDTPVVRASGRELSYVLLVGILLCYLVTFTLVLRPTNAVCGIQRLAAGLCFTVVYAALLTKTNRIARIFNDGRQSAKRPSFISPRSQLIICFGLVSVQILINIVWILIDPARAMHHHPTMEDNLLVCNSYIDASYMIAFAYPIILIAVCTVYAVLTRKIPEAFNESKHIGFAMYTTCVIWLAFVPLYFGTGNNVALRITSMSVTISLSASVMVVCLFSPKLYIILIRPERNVRPNIKAGRPNLTKSSAITATNPSSMMGPVAATTVLTAATCDQNKAIKKHIASTIDCSTQSEYYEMEVKEQKNGKPLATCASRSTQTTNNEKESTSTTTTTMATTTTTTTAMTTSSSSTATVIAAGSKESPDVVASACNKEPKNSTTTKRLNSNARIGNGPLSQSEVSL